jgi:ATP phosphoribosyltransferase
VSSQPLRLALPSKGRPYEDTLTFLEDCGLHVSRPNPRQYVASINGMQDITVVFDHSSEIPEKLRDGSVDVGITGTDSLYERGEEEDERTAIVFHDLGYLRASLVVAVPDAWIDVWTIHDLADLSVRFRNRSRTLRIASDWPNLTRRFLHRQGLYYVDVIEQPGAVESAPIMGYADAVATLTSTGTSLRENRLKMVTGGTVIEAVQCLVANLENLRKAPEKLVPLGALLEMIEARQAARGLISIIANVRGESAMVVARHIWQRPELAGIQGPTVAPVYSAAADTASWYAVTVVVPVDRMLSAVQHFREVGGTGITASPERYVFGQECRSYATLLARLHRNPHER